MATALAAAIVSLSATLLVLLALLMLFRKRGESVTQVVNTLIGLLPTALSSFFTRVGKLAIRFSTPHHTARPNRRDTRVGVRLRFIGTLLPRGDEWRLEEMMNHRNVLRQQHGRIPRFHYLRLLLGVCTIRWETWTDPERRVD
ncbi:hypothetical protein [Streptomyces zaehneri]|uniref:hypothetical protein n=1 Tax=Streptomyces zaehneri TaxID=3051180 RepID=UPI0028D388FC|nr:hypothetical protein [Streptomyces sp. DSM 40713]